MRHLDAYPDDGVSRALDNVLSMDTKTGNNPYAASVIRDVLSKHSIIITGSETGDAGDAITSERELLFDVAQRNIL